MTINSIPLFYWKKMCNIKSFDLNLKKFRLLTVVFWIITLVSISLIVYASITYLTDKEKYEKNKAIIDEYEATFVLDRFFEALAEDVRGLQNQLTGEKELINKYYKREYIPNGYNLNEINKVISKICNQIISRESYAYDERELILLDRMAKKLGYIEFARKPSKDICLTTIALINFSNSFYNLIEYEESEEYRNQYFSIHEKIFQLRKASLELEYANINQVCCAHSWITNDSTPYYNIYDWNHLSIENQLNISSGLPYEYSIENFDKKYNNPNNSSDGVRYFPSFLVEPFTKLTFYNPLGFNPADLKNNLYRAKLSMGSSSEIVNKFLFSLLIIIGVNALFIIVIRIVNWING